jgi:hypothetical protein
MMNYIYGDYLLSHRVSGLLLEKRWDVRDLGELTETIEWAKKHQVQVILFGPLPEYDAPLPRLEAYSVAWNQPNLVSQHRIEGTEVLDRQLQALAASEKVHYISLYRAICENGSCAEYADSEYRVPLMFDTEHLSAAGSLLIAHRMFDQGQLSLIEK